MIMGYGRAAPAADRRVDGVPARGSFPARCLAAVKAWSEARRARRDLERLARSGTHLLRDIGVEDIDAVHSHGPWLRG